MGKEPAKARLRSSVLVDHAEDDRSLCLNAGLVAPHVPLVVPQGKILRAPEDAGLTDSATVLHASDHGDTDGARGLG